MKNFFSFINKNGYLVLGILAILPFLFLFGFVHPVGAHGWDWATRYPGELPEGIGFWEEQKFWYMNVMGRYTSTAIMSLTHFWFSVASMKLFLLSAHLLLFGSLFFLIKSIFYEFSFPKIISISFVAFLIYIDQLTGVYEAFYNFSSVVTYQFGGIFFFLFVGKMVQILSQQQPKTWRNFLIILLLVVLSVGSNEITLLATNGWLSLLLLGGYYYHKRWQKWILFLFVLSLIFSLVEVLAPGNFVRMEEVSQAKQPLLAIFLTFSVSIFNWVTWISSTPLLIFAVLYIPFGIRIAKNNQDSIFRYPLFGLIGLVAFHWLSLFLLFWSQGDETFPERLMDLIFWISLPLLFYIFQCLIVIGLEKKWLSPTLSFSKPIQVCLLLFVAFNLFFSGLKIDKSDTIQNPSNYISIIQTDSNIGTAWLEILSGTAHQYDASQNLIYEKIKTTSADTIYLTPPAVFPKMIYDKTFDRKFMRGEHVMSYHFGKEVIIKYEESEK